MARGARPELYKKSRVDKNKIPLTVDRIDALKVFLGKQWR